MHVQVMGTKKKHPPAFLRSFGDVQMCKRVRIMVRVGVRELG